MNFQSPEIDQLMYALMEVHKEFGVVISKDRKGHKGTYASLPCVLESIHKICSKHGLILTQASRIIDGHNALETILRHPISKQWISCQSILTANVGSQSSDQAWGGSSTYHRRYDAMMLLGIFAEDDPTDNDGHHEMVASKSDFARGHHEMVADKSNLVRGHVVAAKADLSRGLSSSTTSTGFAVKKSEAHFVADKPAVRPVQRSLGEVGSSKSEVGSSPYINEKQHALLLSKIKDNEDLKHKILAMLKIDNFSEIPWREFNKILQYVDKMRT